MKNETQQTKKFRWVPGFIRHDFWRKFFALLFAALVTAAVYSNKRRSMETDVNFNNVKPDFFLEENYKWTKLNPQTITLTLRGPRNVLADLKAEDFEIHKSIAEKEYKDKHVKLSVKDVVCHHPKAGLIQITGISPGEYTLHLQKIVTRKIGIRTRAFSDKDSKRVMIGSIGELPPGYFFDGAEILDHTEVNVTGPEEFVNKLQSIEMEPVSLDDHVATFTTALKLKSPDPSCILDVQRVNVKVHIGRFLTKKYSDIPIRIISENETADDGYVTLPENSRTVTVELRGEKDEFDTFPDKNVKDHLYAFIRKAQLGEGNNNSVKVQCAVADKRLRVISLEPSIINGVVLNLPKKTEVKPPAADESGKTDPGISPEKPSVKPVPEQNQPAAAVKEEGKKTDDPQKK